MKKLRIRKRHPWFLTRLLIAATVCGLTLLAPTAALAANKSDKTDKSEPPSAPVLYTSE